MFEIAKRFPEKTAGLSPAELASWEDGYETAKRERLLKEAIHSNDDPHYRQPRP